MMRKFCHILGTTKQHTEWNMLNIWLKVKFKNFFPNQNLDVFAGPIVMCHRTLYLDAIFDLCPNSNCLQKPAT